MTDATISHELFPSSWAQLGNRKASHILLRGAARLLKVRFGSQCVRRCVRYHGRSPLCPDRSASAQRTGIPGQKLTFPEARGSIRLPGTYVMSRSGFA